MRAPHYWHEKSAVTWPNDAKIRNVYYLSYYIHVTTEMANLINGHKIKFHTRYFLKKQHQLDGIDFVSN